jgi:hypothetical protein
MNTAFEAFINTVSLFSFQKCSYDLVRTQVGGNEVDRYFLSDGGRQINNQALVLINELLALPDVHKVVPYLALVINVEINVLHQPVGIVELVLLFRCFSEEPCDQVGDVTE